MRCRSWIRKLWGNDSGNVSMMFGLALVPMLGVSGAAIDYSRFSNARSALSTAADAGALAGASNKGNADTRRQSAKAAFEANLKQSNFSNTVSVQYTNIVENAENTGFRIEASGSVTTLFGNFLGSQTTGITALAEVKTNVDKPMDIAFVLDTTGSMVGARLAGLKAATNAVLDEIANASIRTGMVRTGVVPFSEYVNVGVGNRSKSWIDVPADTPTNVWAGCVGSRNYPYNVRDSDYSIRVPGVMNVTCPTALQDLTSNLATTRATINGLVAGGNTYLPSGFMWGWTMLSKQEPLPVLPNAGVEASKTMIFVTDGRNTISPAYPKHTGTDVTLANNLTREVCSNMANDTLTGIKLYVIGFELDGLDTKAILKTCAEQTGGQFYDATGADQLRTAMITSLQLILRTRLTK